MISMAVSEAANFSEWFELTISKSKMIEIGIIVSNNNIHKFLLHDDGFFNRLRVNEFYYIFIT